MSGRRYRQYPDGLRELDEELGGPSAFEIPATPRPPQLSKLDLNSLPLATEAKIDPALGHVVVHLRSKSNEEMSKLLNELRELVNLNQPLNQQPRVARLVALVYDMLGDTRGAESLRKRIEAALTADPLLDTINDRLKEHRVPTSAYLSKVFVYSYWVERHLDEIKYQKTPLQALMDKAESRILALDDGGIIGVRHKGTIAEVTANIVRLGLEKEYRLENGKIYQPASTYQDSFVLDDLLRHQQDHHFLKQFDQLEAIKLSTAKIAQVHVTAMGGIGEVLANDLIISKDKKATLALPEVIYNQNVLPDEQMATDLLDFCFSISSAAIQKATNQEAARAAVKKYVKAALSGYQEQKDQLLGDNSNAFLDLSILKTLAKFRPANFFHNHIRFGFDQLKHLSLEEKKQNFEMVRAEIIAFANLQISSPQKLAA